MGEPISTNFEPNLWQLADFRDLRCVTFSVAGVYPEGIVASAHHSASVDQVAQLGQ